MNTVERVVSICKERKIPISKLETDCGFGNAYIKRLRKGSLPDDRLRIVANYLNVSVEYLSTGKEEDSFSSENAKLVSMLRADKRMNEILLKYFNLSIEKRERVLSAIEMIIDGVDND